MGTTLISLYKNKVKNNWRIAFVSCFIIGLVTHIYKFTNTLLNHDSVYNFYSTQNAVGSGRWFLTFACGISSYFDLPWINGILSILYISLTAVIIVDLFEIKNKIPIMLVSGLLVTFPSVTETLFFGFTADGFFLSLLLSVLTVYLCKIERKNPLYFVVGGICLCLSCGIYQAYVSFTVVLAFLYLVYNIMSKGYDTKIYLKWIRNCGITLILSLGAYYAVWKLCLHFQNVTPNDYQGISEVGTFSFSLIFSGIKSTVRTIILFFVEWNIAEHPINLYGVMNIIFIVFLVVGIILAMKKSGLFKSKGKFILVVIFFALSFPAVCMWAFTSDSIGYRPMMLMSISVYYIFALVIYDKWLNVKSANIFAGVMVCVIFNFIIMANISYYYMEKENQKTYFIAQDIMEDINEIKAENEITDIFIYGSRDQETVIDGAGDKVHIFTGLLEKALLYNEEHVYLYLSGAFDLDLPITSKEKREEIVESEMLSEIEAYPESDYTYIIDGTLVVKMAETTSTE